MRRMWLVGVRDLQYRRRRFLIAVVATSVVFSMTVEISRVLDDGSEEQLTVIHPGNYFGELAPMFGLRRSAGARAIDGPATVTGLSLRDFRERRGRSETEQR